jgi:hypothetical protein
MNPDRRQCMHERLQSHGGLTTAALALVKAKTGALFSNESQTKLDYGRMIP